MIRREGLHFIFTFAWMSRLNIPPFLKKGDAVGIFSPARKVAPEEVAPFKALVQAEGYQVVEAGNLYGSLHQFSGSAEQRLCDIQQLFMDRRVKAVFAARGGYGAAQLLPGMDWELVRENPKWLVGFSDVTALHAAMGKFMETLHGVMPYSKVMEEPQDAASFRHLFELLGGGHKEYHLPDHPLDHPGEVEGRLTGGNLSVLYSLAGTRYEPEYEGSILFLEDLDEYLYHIDRMMTNFELRGVFRKISALLVGDFSDMHDNSIPYGKDVLEIIAEKVHKYNLPAKFGFPAGHKKSNFPLIFGRVSTLTIEQGCSMLRMY
jgi:muramoyltetrapeptide carboxypeptidase